MADAETAVTVTDNPDKHRFEAHSAHGGALLGFAEYHLEDGTIVFTHTQVADEAEGKGVGSALATFALDEARRRSLGVVPKCPFIRTYIQRHPAYADLVTASA